MHMLKTAGYDVIKGGMKIQTTMNRRVKLLHVVLPHSCQLSGSRVALATAGVGSVTLYIAMRCAAVAKGDATPKPVA